MTPRQKVLAAMEQAAKLFRYCPKTGLVFSRETGLQQQTRLSSGYPTFSFRGVPLAVHRFGFFCMTGALPIEVDHINRVRADNRWSNLRAATRWQNRVNAKMPNKHGFPGVFYEPGRRHAGQPWRSEIVRNGRKHRLGRFATAEEASAAYRAASIEKFGEFSPYRGGGRDDQQTVPT